MRYFGVGLEGFVLDANKGGADIFEDPVVDHPAAAVRLAAHPADAPNDEGGSAVG